MDFDLISFILGAAAGVVGAGAVGRAKFLVVQNELRQARDYANSLSDQLVQRARTVTKRKTK